MKRSHRGAVYLLAAAFLPACTAFSTASKPEAKGRRSDLSPHTQRRAHSQLGSLPLYFEPNHGQADPAVRYISRGGGFTTLLTGNEAIFANSALRKPLRLKFLNSQSAAECEAHEKLPGISNYFRGKDPSKWATDVPHYAKVRFREVYPGVDVLFYSGDRRLEYDLVVAPGADPGVIALRWEGADGMRIDPSGDLILMTSAGEIRQRRPVVYQQIDGQRVVVDATYLLKEGGRLGFELAQWDRKQPLVIDPQIFYSTFIGGSGAEDIGGIAADPSGAVYITGGTASTNFPLTNAFQTTYMDRGDVFVTKLAIGGGALVYSTYLGGEFLDQAYGIAADSAGNAYVTGLTGSFGYPVTTNIYQKDFSGVQDAFVTKLSPFGNTLVFSTYLGTGDTFETGWAIAVDKSNNPIVAGSTNSSTFPVTAGAFDRSYNGGVDLFVTKLDAQGRQIVFSTFIGGNLDEYPTTMAMDPAGELYVGGYSASTNFPTTANAFDGTHNGIEDGFFLKLSQTGNRLIFSSYLGGAGFDVVWGLNIEPGGRVLVTGETSSSDFPTTANAYERTMRGVSDAFVARFTSDGQKIIASTLLGSFRREYGRAVVPGPGGHLIVAGYSESNNFPSTPDAFGSSANFFGDVFLSVFRPLAETLQFSSIVPGGFSDEPRAMTVDASGELYIAGRTNSPDYSTTAGAFDTSYNQGIDAFVTRITGLNLSDCAGGVNPTGTTYDVAGGGGGIGVTGNCNWWAFTSTPWLALSGSPLQNGAGSLNYTVAPYSGEQPRTGVVNVASNLVHILQRGSTVIPPFQDVPVNDPFVDYVRVIKNNAVTSGCAANAYCPGQNTTRGQMAVFLVRSLLGTDDFTIPELPYFADVPAAHPQFKWIQKLRELGVTTGCNLVQYCPDDPVTRGQMAVFLVRSKFGNNFTYPAAPYFQDVPASHPFFNFIQKLRQVGITTGCTATQYCPNDNNTRGQMAVFLTRMFFTPW
jgi:hypothetical protein